MIDANRVLSSCERVLGLVQDKAKKYDACDGWAALSYAALDVAIGSSPVKIATGSVTAAADDQGTFNLNPDLVRLDAITWPYEEPAKIVTRQRMTEIREWASTLTSEPLYVCIEFIGPEVVLTVEPHLGITAGDMIEYECYVATWQETGAGKALDLPAAAEPMLRYRMLCYLAEQYEPSRVAEFEAKYDKAKMQYQALTNIPTNTPRTAHSRENYMDLDIL